jgi:hypothetical protein
MTDVKIEETKTECLESYLRKQKPIERASTIKLIHKWIPTNAFLYKQRRVTTPCCPRCGQHDETAEHIYSCPEQYAQTERQILLYNKLKELVSLGMPLVYASPLEDKLTSLLAITSKNEYRNTLIEQSTPKAILHQNIIGWDNLLRGYASKHWQSIEAPGTNGTRKTWDKRITGLMIMLYKEIWEGRNNFVHGKTTEETRKKAREAVIARVRDTYKQPPNLAARYPSIFEVSLDNRLKCTTSQLTEWLQRIEHQKKVSAMIRMSLPAGQLTLKQAYQKQGYSTQRKKEYPP